MTVWKDTRDWVRQYLAENPDASVDAICRASDAAGVGVPKEVASQVRRDFRLTRSVVPVATAPSANAISLNPAKCERCGAIGHWISQCREQVEPLPIPTQTYVEPIPLVTPVEVPVPEPKEEKPVESKMDDGQKLEAPQLEVGRLRTIEGTIVRRKRLNEIVDAKPDIHPTEATVQLRAEFGLALDQTYIYETVRLARTVHNLPPIRTREELGPREFGEREKATTVVVEEPERFTVEDELDWLTTRLTEVMRAHKINEIEIRSEAGRLHWSYSVRRSGKKDL